MIFEFDIYLVGVVVDRSAMWLATVDYGLTTHVFLRDAEEIMDTRGPIINNGDAATADLGEQLFVNGHTFGVIMD